MTKVVHCMRENYDVYIGRGSDPKTGKYSKWGNPFSYKEGTIAKYKVNSLEECLQKYKEWIVKQDDLMKEIPKLKGKTLGCWCKPKEGFKGRVLCHGQILAALAEGVNPEDIE